MYADFVLQLLKTPWPLSQIVLEDVDSSQRESMTRVEEARKHVAAWAKLGRGALPAMPVYLPVLHRHEILPSRIVLNSYVAV